MVWREKQGEGIKQKTKQNKPHGHRQQCGDYHDYYREREVVRVEKGKEEINGDRRRLDLGW